jgi:hypothetical protein
MLVNATRAWCTRCGDFHLGEVVEESGRLYGVTHCGADERRVLLSSNAAMFLEFRRRSAVPYHEVPTGELRPAFHFVSITDQCDASCAICCMEAGPSAHAVHAAVDSIVERAAAISKPRSPYLQLFGGEPTLHPQLVTLIERLTALGFRVGFPSNGKQLGRQQGLASRLAAAGLKRVCLQFDSLREETLKELQRDWLPEKKRAIENCRAAGISLGLTSTVTTHNIGESRALLAHGLEYEGGVIGITFGVATPTGRFLFTPDVLVDRERIVERLIEDGGDWGITLDDFAPIPGFQPFALAPHPDCGLHIPFVRTPDGARPLNHYVSLGKLYARMAASKDAAWGILTKAKCLPWLLEAVRPGKFTEVARLAKGLLSGDRRFSLINVAVVDHRAAMFMDEERIRRCASFFLTEQGATSGCMHIYGSRSIGASATQRSQGFC